MFDFSQKYHWYFMQTRRGVFAMMTFQKYVLTVNFQQKYPEWNISSVKKKASLNLLTLAKNINSIFSSTSLINKFIGNGFSGLVFIRSVVWERGNNQNQTFLNILKRNLSFVLCVFIIPCGFVENISFGHALARCSTQRTLRNFHH